jgi:lysophospholipase L1-like esterase
MKTTLKDGEKILFIGDSITDCGRLEENFPLGNGYVKMFSDMLTVREPEKNIKIINRGISGNTIIELKERWHEDVLNHSPDWLSIKIGINDVHRFLMEEQYSYLNSVTFEQIYDLLLTTTKKYLPTCKILLIDPFYISSQSFNDTFRMKIISQLPEYNAAIQKLSEKYLTLCVKTNELFQQQLEHQHPATYCDEPVHPNSAGHLLIAEAVYLALSG